MAATESSATEAAVGPGQSALARRQTIVMVRTALAIACAYLILFSQGSSGATGMGPLVIVFFLASNLVVGRLRPELIGTQPFNVSIAVLDTVLIAASLYFAGQLSVELVVLFLGVLILAIAGLHLGAIASVTIGMSVVYILLVWMGGRESLTQSSMLLRVPFLLCAALVYGWVTEAARSERAAHEQDVAAGNSSVANDLGAQSEAIRRCEQAMADGAHGTACAALDEIAALNAKMQAKLAPPPAEPLAEVTPALARGAA